LRPGYQIEFLRSAAKELAALPKAIQQRIARVIDSLGDDPRQPGTKALQGDGKYLRIRVGDYRVTKLQMSAWLCWSSKSVIAAMFTSVDHC
jgi:phage-related protein